MPPHAMIPTSPIRLSTIDVVDDGWDGAVGAKL